VSPANPDALAIDLGSEDDSSYAALARAHERGADWVIEELKIAGLQGRGGAGFPAHFKWAAVRGQAETTRYVVVNADEAEPATFKDREVMLRRPHRMLEGMAIAGIAVGATKGFAYIRSEYPDAIEVMSEAVRRAHADAQPGDTVLLAPAAASFDQYDSFERRGDDFAACVAAALASGQ
jgi:NADH:ubiquinone oxidoreductase subunit F (NADH-binding)